jgi:hypothetical protein
MLSCVPRKRLLAGAAYTLVGVLGFAVALAVAGCGSGGGGLSTLRTTTLPGVTRPGTTTTPPAGETQTTAPIETTTEASPIAPSVTVTETFPAVTETLPAKVVTVTQTQTLPVSTETLPATTQTLPATTVTTTAVNPAAAAAAGAAVATANQEEPAEETPWGWIAFGILAAAVLIGGVVWWLRRRSARKEQPCWFSFGCSDQPSKRSAMRPCRNPLSLTVSESRPSLSMTVRTTQAPARMTSARLGCRPTISRRPAASRDR